MRTTHEILVRTKAASRALASVGRADKERLLLCMADSLLAHEGDILAANARDMAASAGVITPVMADRLLLTDKRIAGMAQGCGMWRTCPTRSARYCRKSRALTAWSSARCGFRSVRSQSFTKAAPM